MSAYTTINSVSISAQNLYDLMDTYFEGPTLEKVKDDKDVSVYMCKIASLLAGLDQRYLVVTTERDNQPIGKRFTLSNIQWKSFQTRTLPQNLPLPKQSYSPKSSDIFMTPVNLLQRYETHTEYNINGYTGCMLTLLHKNKNLYEYPEQGTIATALETYKTLFIIL
jgi:hypothetical protein